MKPTKMWSILLIFYTFHCINGGILYHRDSETRQSLSLDGLWKFALTTLENPFRGHEEKWYEKQFDNIDNLEIHLMAVPSSYNDIDTNSTVRDHVGLVWYEKEFFIPKTWQDQNVWIRFSSVCYAAEVWINGKSAVSHVIGHLPFQAEISSLINFGQLNFITVSVDNTLLDTTIPQGSLIELDSGRTKQVYTFDFFNYAGIDRPVILYTTPKTFIDDITVVTDINKITNDGIVNYEIVIESDDDDDDIVNSQIEIDVNLLDKNGEIVANSKNSNSSLIVKNPTLWWPYLMDSNPGYLYTFIVELRNGTDLLDIYRLPIGIRRISWNTTNLLINNKPIYLRGFGRHEDSDIRGKGLDLPLILRDYNLIKWIGANSYRTSHYPYAEEIMDLADKYGIMIIDEAPAVNTEKFSGELLLNHKQSLTELIQRDKNRPCVLMWSASNEPRTQYKEAEGYFKQVVNHIKSLDLTRPVTIVNAQHPQVDHSAKFIDIISFNSYQGWYINSGDLDTIVPSVLYLAKLWNFLHNKPVLITEYGGDTLEGLHILPSYIWSEDYQVNLLSKHFEAFDKLREEDWFIGEMIWNFADFKTDQTYTRVGGNKKGIFTRNRQPKAAAYLMRKRYWLLAQYLDGVVELPNDLMNYIFTDKQQIKDEL